MSDIINGLDVLSCFTPKTPVLSNDQVSELTQLPRRTTDRLLSMPIAGGFVTQTRARRYRLFGIRNFSGRRRLRNINDKHRGFPT